MIAGIPEQKHITRLTLGLQPCTLASLREQETKMSRSKKGTHILCAARRPLNVWRECSSPSRSITQSCSMLDSRAWHTVETPSFAIPAPARREQEPVRHINLNVTTPHPQFGSSPSAGNNSDDSHSIEISLI